jgi:hypothetical protein
MHRLVIKKLKPQFVSTKRIHRLKATSWENALGRREINSLETSELEIHDLNPQQLYPHPVAIHSECRRHLRENDAIENLSGI